MKIPALFALPLMVAANAAAAQATPSEHQQHLAGQQPQEKAGAERCCCEQMMHEMHKMMSEMMKMHQGMGGHASHDAVKKTQEPKKH